MVYSSYNWS